ncbi:hypothetical protein TRIUR3_16761 [Triticum urartu]|uniref:Uncharacterized protein n=1 Tax=Triticum urartu TaxID=4572 RepID=M7YU13_TRIUA|nr:hypothetical protein TRIUR3_16761 [Triticum urartu]
MKPGKPSPPQTVWGYPPALVASNEHVMCLLRNGHAPRLLTRCILPAAVLFPPKLKTTAGVYGGGRAEPLRTAPGGVKGVKPSVVIESGSQVQSHLPFAPSLRSFSPICRDLLLCLSTAILLNCVLGASKPIALLQ